MSEMKSYNNISIDNITPSEKFYSITFALLSGLIFDRMFMGKTFGISVFIFASLLIGFFLWSVRKTVSFKLNFGWFLLIPILFISFSFSVYTNEVLMSLNTLALPALMVISSILIAENNTGWDKPLFIEEIIKKSVISPLENVNNPFRILGELLKTKNRSGSGSNQKKQVLTGLLISIPLLFIILSLLSSADMVFNYYIRNMTKIFDNINTGKIISDIFVIFIIALYVFCYIWSFRKKEERKTGRISEPVKLESLTIITVIFILDILYLIFTVIQFSYLYGGMKTGLTASFSYSEYARRGFFELAAVTFINFVLLIICMKVMKRGNKVLTAFCNITFTFLILFTLIMLYSAHFKLSLYENSYGFTYLRVFVHLFMLLLLILCITALIGIWYRRLPMVKAIIIISITFYTAVNYLNIDGFIAKKNIESGRPDILYLTTLSDEAVPYLLKLKDSAGPSDKTILEDSLSIRKERLTRQNYWYELNISRTNLKKLLGDVSK